MAKKPIKVTEVVLRDAHQSLLATRMTMDEMRAEFGDDVAHLVDGVTKLKHLHLTDSTKDPKDKNADRLEMQAENLRKMFLAMAKDIRVILVKLADRLHNMRTAQYWSAPKQKEKGIDKLNSMSLTEKMLLRKNDIGQYKRLQRNK